MPCKADGCSTKSGKGRRFFIIPDPKKHFSVCEQWLRNIKYPVPASDYVYSRNNVVCEDHFEDTCFERTMMDKIIGPSKDKGWRKKLRPDAVPTKFTPKKKPDSPKYKIYNPQPYKETSKPVAPLHEVTQKISCHPVYEHDKGPNLYFVMDEAIEDKECSMEGTCSDGEPSMPELSKEDTESTTSGTIEVNENSMGVETTSVNSAENHDAASADPGLDETEMTLDMASLPLITEIKQEVTEENNVEEYADPDGKERSYSPVVMKQKFKRQLKKDKHMITDVMPEGSENSDLIKVTCGHLNGVLHKELFYCPGIHRACIELENGTFVTPKKFMFMGEKARLKDWKNAIRWGGHQLRKHIEAGTLQFFRHEELCTGRCVARSPYAGKSELYDRDRLSERARLRKEKFEFETLGFSDTVSPGVNGFEDVSKQLQFDSNLVTTVEENGCMKIQSVCSGDQAMWSGDGEEQTEQSEPPDIKPDVKQLQLQMMQTMEHPKPETNHVPIAPKLEPMAPAGIVVSAARSVPKLVYTTKASMERSKGLPPSIMNATMPPVSEKDCTDEEDRQLWQGIVELGLIDEFFREIKTALDLLKNTMVKRLVPLEDSNRISIIVRQLGLMQKLKFKLEAHRTDMDRQRKKLDREMMDLQKRVREYEMKKKLLEKRTECFDQILEIPALKNSPVTSIPRLSMTSGISPSNQNAVFVSSANGPIAPKCVIQPQLATSVATSNSNGPAKSSCSGAKILVFPKQSTQFHTSPEGGLKITMKRKHEGLIDVSAKDSSTSVPNVKSAVKTENGGSEHVSSLDIAAGDSVKMDVTSSGKHGHDELNSSYEDDYHSAKTGDNMSDEGNIKRSKRKRSVKTYDDFIVDNK